MAGTPFHRTATGCRSLAIRAAMSSVWRHTVALRHRSRDHSTQHRRWFPIRR